MNPGRGKRAVGTLLALLLGGCAATGESTGEAEEGGIVLSLNLVPSWTREVDTEGAPVRFFSRKVYRPSDRPTPLRFRAQPPVALPWGDLLCIREGNLVCLDASTGEQKWSSEAETGDWLQVAVYGPRIVVYQGSGRMQIFTADGKSMGEREVMSGSLLESDGERLYLLSPSGVQAFSPVSLREIWSWLPSGRFKFLSMVTGKNRLAVEYYNPSFHHHETALLDVETGLIRHRFLGKALGWSGEVFYGLNDRDREIRGWSDRSGKYLSSRELNGFDGRAIFFTDGDVLWSAENRYYTPAVTRVGLGGATQVPSRSELRSEIQREGRWQVPFEGKAVLLNGVLFDLFRSGVRGWDVSDGRLLYEIGLPEEPERVTLGPGHLYVLLRSGTLHAFAIRK